MKIHESLTPELQAWMKQQKLFFVSSAPLTATGHVNVSPKGYDCLRIIDSHTVCYIDMTGSGNETSAHVAENGRLTFMFCALEGAPRILRLYGQGQVILRGTPAFDKLIQTTQLPLLPSARQIVVNHVHKITTSCGYAVPKFDYVKDRSTLTDYVQGKAETDPDMILYQQENNLKSIDGIVTPLGRKYGASTTSSSTTSTSSDGQWPRKLWMACAVVAVACVLTVVVGAPPSPKTSF